jgi:thiol-disulfide isomerase/thioredoxin
MQSPTLSTANGFPMSGGNIQAIMTRVQTFVTNNIIIIVAIIAFSILGYLLYNQFVNKNSIFNANREHTTTDPNSNKTAEMMLFYVDWCPHCKTAKPEWETLKSEYEGKQINGYNLKFTEYNCTAETSENEALMNKYKIEGYPTIKLLKGSEVIEYDAKPTKVTMEQFLHTVL